jgi:TPR repeat protein
MQIRHREIFRSLALACALIAVVLLESCATLPSAVSDYNQGVDAYRSKDYVQARKHWTVAVASGDSTAMNNLGYLLYFGLGGDVDARRAVEFWKRASALGEVESQWHLGDALHAGKGVARDDVAAYGWLRCSAAGAAARASAGDELAGAIAGDARNSLAEILGQLTKDDFEAGERQAKECIALMQARAKRT